MTTSPSVVEEVCQPKWQLQVKEPLFPLFPSVSQGSVGSMQLTRCCSSQNPVKFSIPRLFPPGSDWFLMVYLLVSALEVPQISLEETFDYSTFTFIVLIKCAGTGT